MLHQGTHSEPSCNSAKDVLTTKWHFPQLLAITLARLQPNLLHSSSDHSNISLTMDEGMPLLISLLLLRADQGLFSQSHPPAALKSQGWAGLLHMGKAPKDAVFCTTYPK